jgi:hypothetical protein
MKLQKSSTIQHCKRRGGIGARPEGERGMKGKGARPEEIVKRRQERNRENERREA